MKWSKDAGRCGEETAAFQVSSGCGSDLEQYLIAGAWLPHFRRNQSGGAILTLLKLQGQLCINIPKRQAHEHHALPINFWLNHLQEFSFS